ncbi:MAG: DHH family phosphoesterase [Candidatus Thalassarchaeaceae archaeon]|nr:DHH family phosphoesterase [Candidatus Thalassarchaeaceae archaeon]MDP7042588.1 DHH family phosphoesterase [Candidatus Thalassarchaeaceae archaeon]
MGDISDLLKLHDWICEKREQGAIAVLTHKNGDMDTIGSATALAELIGHNAKACGIHISKIAKKVLTQTKNDFHLMDPSNPMWPRTLAGIIVVDTASPSQTGLNIPEDVPTCVIDHHQGGSDWGDVDINICWNVTSTAEIVHSYSKEFNPEGLDAESATQLLAGIITDTGRFKHADSGSFKAASEIIERYSLDYASFVESLEKEDMNHSQKVSIAKSLTKVEAIDAGNWFLLHTTGGTNEGVIAHSLLTAGAEVALVVRRAKHETRLIARATRSAVNDGVHLGKLMSELTETLEGEGGGHAGAAGWSGDVPAITACSGFIASLSAVRRG